MCGRTNLRFGAYCLAGPGADYRGGGTYLHDAVTIHISGCAKGCAQAAPAALTIVGTPEGGALIANGSPRDGAYAVVPAHELPAAITAYLRERKHEAANV